MYVPFVDVHSLKIALGITLYSSATALRRGGAVEVSGNQIATTAAVHWHSCRMWRLQHSGFIKASRNYNPNLTFSKTKMKQQKTICT